MSNITKVAKKMLMRQSFLINGYEYQFISVRKIDEFEIKGTTYTGGDLDIFI
jgi:hypothetical protein